ncbi:LPS export ABC transporter permease LptG [Accumulibacter sp.]|uniref:LPS export ABC transporter permease LptG n=1 Tax=Accumulibacter sp. TaxID=2053492 RepID=UPI0025F7BEDD|nr:LPS export ABC transporter permease LptG [Accumulibacter sp.]MCM8595817.1 LPS export ABC transporter permease LptG [Accumulibacter sp.]MCM8626538.1 LPS export ABC transporter permease LptG [Accumulibacter sp.]MDS4049965.1 LPS export ABC transporter permease LptG [Accumulibacter sp.]
MKVYQLHIAREVAAATLLVLLAFLGLFAFFDLLAEVKSIGQGGYKLQHAFGVVALRVPGRAYELMPLAVLIGTLYGLSTLSRHSELTVLRASGLSIGTFLGVLFRVAAVFAVATFLIGEFVAPPAEQAANRLRVRERSGVVREMHLASGLWVRDEQNFINVRLVASNTRLSGIRIYEFDREARLSSITEAASGEYMGSDKWRLSDVVRTVVHDTRAEVERISEMSWHSALNPDILSVLTVSPDRMSLRHLSAYTKHLADNRQKTNRYDIAFWKKVVYPLSAFVMAALALPFGGAHYRAAAVGLKIFTGVMIGVLFHTLNGLFSNLGAINNWSPLFSVITPSLLFLFAATTLIWWTERR